MYNHLSNSRFTVGNIRVSQRCGSSSSSTKSRSNSSTGQVITTRYYSRGRLVGFTYMMQEDAAVSQTLVIDDLILPGRIIFLLLHVYFTGENMFCIFHIFCISM